MTSHHAVEIVLTRPLTAGELKRAGRSVPLAANADRTRLMAVQRAYSPGNALHVLRRRLGSRLPIDVLSTHYPDRHGQVRLNVAFSRSAEAAIRQAAAALGQRPKEFLGQSVTAALARQQQDRCRLLEIRLQGLLAHHTPEEVLACAATALSSRHHRCPPTRP
ncbi:hypothetical protein [Streptomyces bluensis]|uniref:hypothetical protein n=1 Tax=Streptomyces bluensis TaxID=33897 RepID=UPI001679F284|nr:hypothetical protein [Streptomyces bluensis]